MSNSDNQAHKNKNDLHGTIVLVIIQVTFVVLKLLNLVDWDWKIVTAPVWLTLAISGVAIIVSAFFKAIFGNGDKE